MGPDRTDPGRTHSQTSGVRRASGVSFLVTLGVLSLALIDGGGLADGWAVLIATVAALDLALATILKSDLVLSYIRRPLVVALLILSVVGLCSLSWTALPISEVLAPALVPAGLGALVVYAALTTNGERLRWFLWWLAAMGVLVAISGLIGVCFKSGVWSNFLGGTRRPAGTVGYSTALVLLQSGALIVLLRIAAAKRGMVRATSIAALAVVVGTVILTQARLPGLFIALVLLCCATWPAFTLGSGKPEARWVVLSSAAVGIVVASVVEAIAPGGEAFVAAILAAWVGAAGVSWLLQVGSKSGLFRPGTFVAAGLVVLLAAVLLGTTRDSSLHGVQGNLGFSHGRVEMWVDSVPAFTEKPILGHGQGTYLTATAMDLDQPSRFAHNVLVENAVELGLLGLLAAALVAFDSIRIAWQGLRNFDVFPLLPYFALFTVLLFTDWVWHMSAMAAIWAIAAGVILANSGWTRSSE